MNNSGHNSGGVAEDQIRSIVARIERLEEEKKALTADIREVYSEAKGNGFDAPALRKIVAMRKIEAPLLAEMETIIDLYKNALGMA